VELGIAPKTVNNHLSAVYRRLGARNLTQAVLLAARAGLVDVGSFA
jgi:DNA-binding CsgD family transcriptional regulator